VTYSPEQLRRAYTNAVAARMMDAKILILLKQGKIFFHIGGSGHEGIQVGMALAMRPGKDWTYPYYRDMGFALQYGTTVEEVMRDAMHRAAGISSGGFAMPFHYGDRELRMVAQSSPTGTQYLQAVGTAMGAVREGTDEVVYVSSGEGATSEGEFHEALNWASREKLPVIFLIQNNGYAISVPVEDQVSGGSVSKMVQGYEGLHRFTVDGSDFPQILRVTAEAVALARSGKGPVLIEAHTVRLLPHSSSDDQRKYRPADDLAQEAAKDPIPLMEQYLIAQGVFTADDAAAIRKEMQERIDKAAVDTEALPLPDPADLERFVYAPAAGPSATAPAEIPVSAPKIVMVDAINHALAEELEHNPQMLIYGEDVGGNKGGVFTATRGLAAKFGDGRVFNSQLAEASIIGTAFGLSVRGTFKPVVEIQFGDYIWPAFMQIRNEVAVLRYRSNNHWTCPMVIRVAVGGYIHGGLYHSQSIEAFFTHVPGLRVVFPSCAADAKGLLKYACRCDDPVLFLEHKGLYRQSFAATPEPPADYLLPFGQASIRRAGEDLTVITWGMIVQRALEAARKIEERMGASVEVIDLRTLNPLDRGTILASVRKTGKVIVAHEDTLTGGFGAEITAIIATEAFDSLDAPIVRIAAKDTPVPYAPTLENAMLPQEADLFKAMERLLKY
jgi:2-oxoisovalerate dehydrogenase E1 component